VWQKVLPGTRLQPNPKGDSVPQGSGHYRLSKNHGAAKRPSQGLGAGEKGKKSNEKDPCPGKLKKKAAPDTMVSGKQIGG